MNKTHSLDKEQAEMIDTAYKKGYEQGKLENPKKADYRRGYNNGWNDNFMTIIKVKAEERKRILKGLIEDIKKVNNPYPKDIFAWDNEEPIGLRNEKNLIDVVITRGRFNKFIHGVVENTRQDIIKELEDKK